MGRFGRMGGRLAAVVGVMAAAAACSDSPTGLEPGPEPTGYSVRGIDVSHWQGVIAWPSVAGAGVDFAFIKATEGGDYTDPRFSANWAGAWQAGIIRGAYHYFRPQTDAAAQARHFLATAQLQPGDLPPVLDVEATDGRPDSEIAAGVRTWLQMVEQATGRTPIVYTRASFWNPHLGPGDARYPLWVAHYDVPNPTLPGGWTSWTFWQHSDDGRVPGITGAVDLNWFNGTRAQLEALASGG